MGNGIMVMEWKEMGMISMVINGYGLDYDEDTCLIICSSICRQFNAVLQRKCQVSYVYDKSFKSFLSSFWTEG